MQPRVWVIAGWLVLSQVAAAAWADEAVQCLAYGAQLRNRGQPQEALVWIDRAFRLQPSYEAQLERGKVWFDLGQLDHALGDFRAASRLRPHDPEPHWLQAKVWWKTGNLEAAESEFTRALAIRSDYVPAALHRGYVRLARKQPGGALADGELAVQLQPGNVAGYALRGRARLEVGDLIGAEIDFDQVVHRTPRDIDARARRGEVRLALKDVRGAWEDAEAIRRQAPQQHQAYRLRAKVYLHQGNGVQAEHELNTALRLASAEAQPTLLLDRALVRLALGRGQEALADLSESIRLAPDRKLEATRAFEAALRAQVR